MLMPDYRDICWWYWVASTVCLWMAVTVSPVAFDWALLIGVVQLVHFMIAERSVTSFPIQIRVGYLCVLLLSTSEGMQWILWLPAIGTLIRVTTGYCIMARNLMLMPFNRDEKLTLQFIRKAYLTPPVRGNILKLLSTCK